MCKIPSKKCDDYYDQLKTFVIKLDDVYYTIPSRSLLKTSTTEQNGDECIVNVVYEENSTDKVVFIGQPFVETFVTMFDYENGRMEFAMNVMAYDGAEIVGPPKPKTRSPGSKFGIILLVFIIVVITIITLVYIYRCYSRSRS